MSIANEHELQSLSDDELLDRLSKLMLESRRMEAVLVAHIGEVDHRRLYASRACSSMFAYCTEVLHLTEQEAYLRIGVARAARRRPVLFQMLADGRLSLTAITLLAPHLTDENSEHVLSRAEHRTRREIEELVAELLPRPDVRPSIRKLPARTRPALQAPAPTAPVPQLCSNRVEAPVAPTTISTAKPAPWPEPLSPERFKIQFTASKDLRDKLERLQPLTGEALVAAIEASVTERLERVEPKRFAKTKAPRKSLEQTDLAGTSRYIPAPVRREVATRDSDRCTFVDRTGRRCSETRHLEFHHGDPYGRGGDHDPSHLRLLCRTHNLFLAERDYGEEVMDRFRPRCRSEHSRRTAPGVLSDLYRAELTLESCEALDIPSTRGIVSTE